MPITDKKKHDSARVLGRRIFVAPSRPSHTGTDGLMDVVEAIDDAMDMVINTIPAALGTKTIKQALIDNLPEPFRSASTAGEKAQAIIVWAEQEAGLI